MNCGLPAGWSQRLSAGEFVARQGQFVKASVTCLGVWVTLVWSATQKKCDTLPASMNERAGCAPKIFFHNGGSTASLGDQAWVLIFEVFRGEEHSESGSTPVRGILRTEAKPALSLCFFTISGGLV